MNFQTASGRLMQAVRVEDIAETLGVSPITVRRWRVDPAKDASRTPSLEWKSGLAKLARRRAGELTRLAEQLERGNLRLL